MIFADTSFFVAGFNPKDSHHSAALALREQVEGRRLLTTNRVRGECWTFARRRLGHAPAVALVDGIDATGRYEVVRLGDELEREALHWLRRHDEREYSFVDATSFAFMSRHGIRDALAFDGDFTAAGFVELRP